MGVVFKGHWEKTTPTSKHPFTHYFLITTRKNSISIVFIKCFHIHDLSFFFNLFLQVRVYLILS